MSNNVLVLFYSRHGSIENMAQAIALGVESAGANAILRTVPSLNQTDCDNPQNSFPIISQNDLNECDAIALGTPCRFGTMAAPMKQFWETTSTEWIKGSLIDKPACVFTSSASLHGGNEATLLTLALPLIHHGMMLLGIPYSEPELNSTQTGGTPYGASHVSGLNNDSSLSKDEHTLCVALGARIARTAIKLSK